MLQSNSAQEPQLLSPRAATIEKSVQQRRPSTAKNKKESLRADSQCTSLNEVLSPAPTGVVREQSSF